jgi:large subunit ribosomal protein L13e
VWHLVNEERRKADVPMKVHSIVQKKGNRTKGGRGFSRGELREAGIDVKRALKLGVPVDSRRKTKHEENVKRLKQFLRSLD